MVGEGQILFQGFVKDAVSSENLPFANIGILGTAKGTNSDQKGAFSIELSKSDTLKISYVGYKIEQIIFNQLTDTILLSPYSQILDEVVIPVEKEKRKKIKKGNSNQKTWLIKGGANQYAILVKNDTGKSGFLEEIVFYLQPSIKNNDRFESLIRLRIYANENGSPGRDLMFERIEKQITKRAKKLKFNTSKFSIPYPIEGVFIGLDLVGFYDDKDNYYPYSIKNLPSDTQIDFVSDNKSQYPTFSKFFGTEWRLSGFTDNKGTYIRVAAKFLSKVSY